MSNKLQQQTKFISNSNNALNESSRTPIKSILKKPNTSLKYFNTNVEINQFKDSNNRYSSLADMYLDYTLNQPKSPDKNSSICLLNFPDILETSFRHNVINDPSVTLADNIINELEKNQDVISLNVDFSNDEEIEANYEISNKKETFRFEMDPKKYSLEMSFSSSSSSDDSCRSTTPMTDVSSTSSITYYDDFYISNKLSRNVTKKRIEKITKNMPASKSASCLTNENQTENVNLSNSLSSFSSSSTFEKSQPKTDKFTKKQFKNIKNDIKIYENMCMFVEFNRKYKFREDQKLARREHFLKNTRVMPKKDFNESHINIFDDYLLIYIFSKLSTIDKLMLQFVCKRWHQIIWSTEYTYKLFSSIEITSDSCLLFKPLPKTETISKNYTFTKFFRKKPQKLVQTKSLSLNQTGVKILNIDSVLKFLLTKLVNRQTYPLCLCVEKIRIRNTNRLTERGLELIANLCPELKHLSLRNCLGIKSCSIEKIIETCENLKYLDLTGCYNLTNFVIRIQSKSVEKNNGALNNLYKKLIGNPKRCEETPPKEGKKNLKQDQFNVAQYLYLQFIDLSFCSNITDKSLESLCKTCIYIKNLYLRRCKQVTDIGVLYIAKYCVNLRELSLCQCVKVTDTGVKYLGNDKILYSSSKNSITDTENSRVLIKNKDFKYKIKYLSLAECPLITDYSLIYLCKLGFFQQIKYLNLRGCTKITDKFTKYLVGSNTIVKLIQNQFESNFNKLRSKFSIPFDLKSIDLSKCSISDKSIEYLCRLTAIKPDSLQRLSLRYCDGITDEGIKHLAMNCKNLQNLNVTKCNKVTAQSLKEIKKNCPSCVIQHTNFSFC